MLLGPAHYVPVASIATTGADVWRTPLGDVPIDDELRRAALALPGVEIDDQRARARAQPRGAPAVPPARARRVHAAAVRRRPRRARDRRRGPRRRVGRARDARRGQQRPQPLPRPRHRGGTRPAHRRRDRGRHDRLARSLRRVRRVPGARAPARAPTARACRPRLVELRNSGDTAGPRDRVVGYGAFALLGAGSRPGTRPGARSGRRSPAAWPRNTTGRCCASRSTPSPLVCAPATSRTPDPDLVAHPELGAPGARLRHAGTGRASPRLRREPRADPPAGRGGRPRRVRGGVRGSPPPRRRPRRLLRDVGQGVGAVAARAAARGGVRPT